MRTKLLIAVLFCIGCDTGTASVISYSSLSGLADNSIYSTLIDGLAIDGESIECRWNPSSAATGTQFGNIEGWSATIVSGMEAEESSLTETGDQTGNMTLFALDHGRHYASDFIVNSGYSGVVAALPTEGDTFSITFCPTQEEFGSYTGLLSTAGGATMSIHGGDAVSLSSSFLVSERSVAYYEVAETRRYFDIGLLKEYEMELLPNMRPDVGPTSLFAIGLISLSVCEWRKRCFTHSFR